MYGRLASPCCLLSDPATAAFGDEVYQLRHSVDGKRLCAGELYQSDKSPLGGHCDHISLHYFMKRAAAESFHDLVGYRWRCLIGRSVETEAQPACPRMDIIQ